MRRALLLWWLCAPALACAADGPDGRWEGSIRIPGRELPLVVDLAPGSSGGWTGSLIIPGLGLKGAPLSNIVVGGSDVGFDLGAALRDPKYGPAKFNARMALIPEDRKTEGLMLPMSVRDNLSFAALGALSHWGVIDAAAERDAVDRIVRQLAVRSDGIHVPAGALSGGNQQKLVIGKWLMMGPRILLLNDPTRGIDVGTKQEMYQLLRKLAEAGAAILFYSTDYDELVGCCDRVLVMAGLDSVNGFGAQRTLRERPRL